MLGEVQGVTGLKSINQTIVNYKNKILNLFSDHSYKHTDVCLFFSSFKGVELLVCDLLLTLRTSLWQRGSSSNGEPGPAPGSQVAGFQRDLSALRKLTQCYRQAQHKVHL